MAKMTNAEIHAMIADRMLTALEAGRVPWRKPWVTETGASIRPLSMSSGNPYRGINVWTLGIAAADAGYNSPFWGTFDRIAELSGMVRIPRSNGHGTYWASPDGKSRGIRKGEKSRLVVHWRTVTKVDPDGNADKNASWMVGSCNPVFNACQADELPLRYFPELAPPGDQPAELPEPQAVLDAYISRGPILVHAHQDRAFYQSGPDRITMPERSQFKSAERYYSTAFHEAGHSTGHPRRLNRPGIAEFDEFGSEKYGKEELAAEMTAAMLCAATGVEGTLPSSADYIASWINSIKGDNKMVSAAASQAQAAMDLVMGTEAVAELAAAA